MLNTGESFRLHVPGGIRHHSIEKFHFTGRSTEQSNSRRLLKRKEVQIKRSRAALRRRQRIAKTLAEIPSAEEQRIARRS
jgi:hypothetical protein